jgi:inner membrane protein
LDNLTHTLVGAALAEAGLKKRTALGAATLVIGANFPDIDVLAVPFGVGLEVRRGVTHGFLALAVLPFVLAGIMWLWDRRVRLRRSPDAPTADIRQLVLLSTIAIATHPALDYMNTYGMRWLMPFVDKWFYADGLFIVDIWIIIALATGYVWSRRTGRPRAARVALTGVASYVVAMLLITGAGRLTVGARYTSRFMVEPIPLVPWHRDVLVDDRTVYRLGRYEMFRGLTMSGATITKGDRDPAADLARRTPEAQRFLRWSRFPFYRVVQEGGKTVVRIADARYMGDDARGWAAIEVRLP